MKCVESSYDYVKCEYHQFLSYTPLKTEKDPWTFEGFFFVIIRVDEIIIFHGSKRTAFAPIIKKKIQKFVTKNNNYSFDVP